jgi:hypothetical protein
MITTEETAKFSTTEVGPLDKFLEPLLFQEFIHSHRSVTLHLKNSDFSTAADLGSKLFFLCGKIFGDNSPRLFQVLFFLHKLMQDATTLSWLWSTMLLQFLSLKNSHCASSIATWRSNTCCHTLHWAGFIVEMAQMKACSLLCAVWRKLI